MTALCAHVEFEWEGKNVRVTQGVAVPVFGWLGLLEGDTPLLKCSVCGETEQISGVVVVFLNRGTWTEGKVRKHD